MGPAMKIAIRSHLYPPLGIGGAERSVQYLAEALVHRGHDVLVITSNAGLGTRRETVRGVRVVRLGAAPGYGPDIFDRPTLQRALLRRLFRRWKPKYPKRVLEEVQKFQADVVHTNTGAALVETWQICRDAGYAVVHTLRNPNLLCDRRMFAEGRSCERQCDRCSARHGSKRRGCSIPHAVVGISDFILQKHLTHDYFSEVRVRRVVPNSYESSAPPNAATHPPDGSRVRFGFLGRLHRTKGIEELLIGMRQLERDAILLVGGTGNPGYVKRLRAMAGPNVQFLDFVDSQEFLRKIDILVVPSVWEEPFGRVYAEAMCHGKPIVGSIYGAGPELVKPDVTGWLCDPLDPESLLAALRRAQEDIKAFGAEERLRENCLSAAARFSPDIVAAQYEEVYEMARSQAGALLS